MPVSTATSPGFLAEHFIKDMEVTLAEAERMNLSMPGLWLARELDLALRAQGGGRDRSRRRSCTHW